MLLCLFGFCWSLNEFCLRPDERLGDCYNANRTVVKSIGEFLELFLRNETTCLLEVLNDDSTVDEINLTLFDDTRIRTLTIEGHETSVLRMRGYDYQSLSTDPQTLSLKNIEVIPVEDTFIVHGLVVENARIRATKPVALDVSKVTGGLSFLSNFSQTTVRRSNFYLKRDEDYPTCDVHVIQVNPQDTYADQLISPIYDVDIDINDTTMIYTFRQIGKRMFVRSLGGKFGIMLTHDQPGVVVSVDSQCHELQTLSYMGAIVSNKAVFAVKRSEMFLNFGNQHDILAQDDAIIRLVDNTWGMFLGVYGKNVRIEVAGEHNILYSLNMLGTDASATFVSIVESPKSLPVVLHLNHLQLEAPGSLHSLSSDDELIVEPEITYARRFGGTFHYNLTYYAETAMVIDATIDLRIKSMTGPFRLYFEQQMQHKGPIIQVENVMALQRGSWFLTDGNAMPLTNDDIEPVLNQDYYFYCGEHLDCSNTSIEYDSLDSVGFTEETAISKSFCKKVEGLGTCSGFQFIDVFSHIALDLCYYETDPALCSEYNYTISKDDVGSLNDKCVFPGTHKLSIHVAEDMSDGAAFDFDDITKSAFKLRVEFNSTDGQAKKVNVKFSDKTPSVISRMRLDHTIINFESKTTSKDLLIEGLEWGEDVQFASGSLLNPDSPKEIDIPFCAFGKSNIDAFSEVRIASEEEYEIEYIDDGWSLASAKCSGMQYVRTEKSPNMYMWSGIFPSPFTVSVTMSSNVTRPVPMHFRHGNANGKESHDQTTIFSFSREMENYTGIPIVISDAFNGTKTQVYGYYVPVLAPYANDFRVWQRRGMRNEVRVPYQQYHSNSLWVTNTIEDAFSTSFDGVNFTQRKARMYAYNTNHEERICSLKSFDCTKDAELTFESLRLNGDFALSSGQKVFLDYVSFANTTITLNIDLNAKSNHVIEQLLDARLPTSAVPNQVLINIDGSQAESSNISIVIITSPIANEWLSISTINTLSDDWNASLLVTNTSLIVTATRTTPSKYDNRTKMIIGISVAAVSAIVILVVVVLICRRRRHNPANIQATPLLKSMS